jgi:multidrug efflux pump subunit AcrB
MKRLAWALAIIITVGLLAAVFLLPLRSPPGVECPASVVIVRGRGGALECVCVNGMLSACFEPGL